MDAQDISESVENIEFSTREGSIWVKKNKDADGQYSFNSDDSIKAELSCKHISVSKFRQRGIYSAAEIYVTSV